MVEMVEVEELPTLSRHEIRELQTFLKTEAAVVAETIQRYEGIAQASFKRAEKFDRLVRYAPEVNRDAIRAYAREARIEAESYQLVAEQEQQKLKFYQLQERHLRALEKGAK